MKNSQKFDSHQKCQHNSRNFQEADNKMNPIEYEKLRWQESETVQNLLKRQNTLLGDSLENLDHLIYLQKSINLLSLIKRVRV